MRRKALRILSPIAKQVEQIIGANNGQVFGKNAYATEGWCVSNRGWEATVTFATLGTQKIRIFDEAYKNEIASAKSGQTITVELNSALNQNWNKPDRGWVEMKSGKNPAVKMEVMETGNNSGLFVGKFTVPTTKTGDEILASYGYLGFGTMATLNIK